MAEKSRNEACRYYRNKIVLFVLPPPNTQQLLITLLLLGEGDIQNLP
jgi:hypothetical protein